MECFIGDIYAKLKMTLETGCDMMKHSGETPARPLKIHISARKPWYFRRGASLEANADFTGIYQVQPALL